jgi:predicted esterase
MAHILSPQGKVLEHGMPRFFRRLSEGVFDIEDLKLRTEELRDFIISSRATYNLEASLLYAVGYSNGANIAASLLLSYPYSLDVAVLFRAMLPFTPDTLPNLMGTSVLMLNGENDTMINRDAVTPLFNLLQQAGARAEQRWQPTGHQLSMSDVLAAKEWLQEL